MGRVDASISKLASRTDGVITYGQLRGEGIGDASIRRRIVDGSLVRWGRGIYVAGSVGDPPPLASRLRAAVLAGGQGAVLSHDTAIAHMGAWKRWSGKIHVTSPTHRAVVHPDFRLHRAAQRLPPEAVCDVDGIPTMAAPWACALLGTELTEVQVTAVIDRLHFLGLLDPHTFWSLLDELGRPRGVRTVRRALEQYLAGSTGTRSKSEDRMHEGLLRTQVPRPLVNVRGAVLVGIELDLVWPRHRLVVEVDGEQHDFDHALMTDQEVDEALEDAGWRCIRLRTRRVWSDLGGCIRDVTRALHDRDPARLRKRRRNGSR